MNDVTNYILKFNGEQRTRLEQVRSIIQDLAPQVVESISYGMPAYKTYGYPLVYFAGFKNHIGLYATPSGHAAFKEELKTYKQGKGSVQFINSETFPSDLIKRIIAFRVAENDTKYSSSPKTL